MEGSEMDIKDLREKLLEGHVIPAHPLALNSKRRLDEKRQVALTRYYISSGVGGIAVGVHTTQFAIHDKKVGLYKPVLKLAAETAGETKKRIIKIAGICGDTRQAVEEAESAKKYGYDAGLLSLSALRSASLKELLVHSKSVAEVIPLFGFYLQPAVGGRRLGFDFWRRFFEIENVVAVKIAPFNRYYTLDVIRALVESGREKEIALYTGNDDSIVYDLITPFEFRGKQVRIAGGLLGHWAFWTQKAVELFDRIKSIIRKGEGIPTDLLKESMEITDCNSAVFDASNDFKGCVPGINEVLRRDGLLENTLCIKPEEVLSSGQKEEIDRIYRTYSHLRDDAFIQKNIDNWLNSYIISV
jgi:dihydrodipicolinate synthase/N-acetylneuraminate lyase